MIKKYVITGPSSCGKTTLIEAFAQKGFFVVREVARTVLEEGEFHPSKDPFLFQQEIAKRQCAEEDKLHDFLGVVFLDRGFYDQIAFCKHAGVETFPSEIRLDAHYDAVFLLEGLSFFESDGVRVEKDAKEANGIVSLFREEYQKRNIPIFDIPACGVEERVENILEILG